MVASSTYSIPEMLAVRACVPMNGDRHAVQSHALDAHPAADPGGPETVKRPPSPPHSVEELVGRRGLQQHVGDRRGCAGAWLVSRGAITEEQNGEARTIGRPGSRGPPSPGFGPVRLIVAIVGRALGVTSRSPRSLSGNGGGHALHVRRMNAKPYRHRWGCEKERRRGGRQSPAPGAVPGDGRGPARTMCRRGIAKSEAPSSVAEAAVQECSTAEELLGRVRRSSGA